MANQSISPENMSNKSKSNQTFYSFQFLIGIMIIASLTIFSCKKNHKDKDPCNERCDTITPSPCKSIECSSSIDLVEVLDKIRPNYMNEYFPIVNNELVIDYTKVSQESIEKYADSIEIDKENKTDDQIFRETMEYQVRTYLEAEVYNLFTLDTVGGAFSTENDEFIQCVCGTNLYTYRNETLVFKEHEPQTSSSQSPPQKESDIQLNLIFQTKFNNQKNLKPAEPGNNSQNSKVVAFLDSGVSDLINYKTLYFADSNLDDCVQDSALHGYNFTFEGNQRDITDRDGHGTLTILSFLEAIEKLDGKGMNIKPDDFQILPVKVIDSCGFGSTFSLACGIYYAQARDAEIINISLGYIYEDTIILNALDTIARDTSKRQKTLVVCSAGNKSLELGEDNSHFPSQYAESLPNVFEVGAMCSNVKSTVHNPMLAEYSNFRNKMKVEYGNNAQMLSTSLPDSCSVNGTSFAAPRFSAGVLYYLLKNSSSSTSVPIDTSTFTKPTFKVIDKCYYSITDNPDVNGS